MTTGTLDHDRSKGPVSTAPFSSSSNIVLYVTESNMPCNKFTNFEGLKEIFSVKQFTIDNLGCNFCTITLIALLGVHMRATFCTKKSQNFQHKKCCTIICSLKLILDKGSFINDVTLFGLFLTPTPPTVTRFITKAFVLSSRYDSEMS